jgi:hypothetical protein
MNNLAISPYIGMHALQIQNVKREVVKKVSISELNPLLQNPPLKKVSAKQEPNPLLEKVEQNANVKPEVTKEESAPSAQVPEPFLANSSETVGVLAKSDL